MESLTCYLEDGGPAFSEDIEFPVELLARSKNLVKDWDAKLLPDLYKNMPSFDRETVDNMEFVETNLPERIGISLLDNSSLGASSDKMTDNMVLSTSMVNSDPLIWEGFASTLSAISAEPHSKKQLTVDRKLEKWTDSIQADRILNSEENLVSSLVKDSLPAKRARTTNLHPHNSLCQVHGCYKDLNSSKDYHKRHRVCDVHSKSAKVIVNGIEKRFCQQCSRFHLLTEFDEGKRSCRKRLAGHNERRRKPQLGAHLSSEFLEMTLLKRTSFLSPETFPAGFFYKERFDNDNHSRNIKFIQLPIDNSQVAVSVEHGQPRKSLADPHTKLQPSQTCIDTDSGGALSLLSAQSQNTSSASADLSMVLPPVNGVRHHAYIGMDQNFSKNLENSTLKRFAINGYSSGTIDQEGIPRYHDGNLAFGFKVPREGTFQNSKCKHPNSCLSPEVGIIDLLQLSSHLQRVEQQRKSLLVKQEDETMTFCCSSTM